MKPLRWTFSVLLLLAAVAAQDVRAVERDEAQGWGAVRSYLFQERPISTDAAGILALETPTRAEDAAIVPVVIRTLLPQSETRYIQRITLIIDKNPSPVAGTFTFTPASGRADIETRVRIDEYTNLRAVAETNDGQLYMVTRFVKASGGCSAPAGKDAQAALANLGRMKFRLDGDVQFSRPNLVQLMISHPNNSGMAMDQVTHLFVPARFVRQVQVSYNGKPIMNADVDFSISENPNFRFYFVPEGPGELTAEVVDSTDSRFQGSLPVAATLHAGS